MLNLDLQRRVRRVGRFLQNTNWLQRIVLLVVVGVIIFALWTLGASLRDRVQTTRTHARDTVENANDQRHEQKAREYGDNANVHEREAKEADVERRIAEANANLAAERRREANDNSRRAADTAAKAKDDYEKALNSNLSDLPTLTDEQLCAELRRRGRACR